MFTLGTQLAHFSVTSLDMNHLSLFRDRSLTNAASLGGGRSHRLLLTFTIRHFSSPIDADYHVFTDCRSTVFTMSSLVVQRHFSPGALVGQILFCPRWSTRSTIFSVVFVWFRHISLQKCPTICRYDLSALQTRDRVSFWSFNLSHV